MTSNDNNSRAVFDTRLLYVIIFCYCTFPLFLLEIKANLPINEAPSLLPVGIFNLWHKQFIHIKGNITFVLMNSGTVNGYQLLCDAHTVLEPHRGTAALFLFH